MKYKHILSILLSFAVIISMCVPCASFAAEDTEDNATYKFTVTVPVGGQTIPENCYSIAGPEIVDSTGYYEVDGIQRGAGCCFSYDKEITFIAAFHSHEGTVFTGTETVSVNGNPASVSFTSDYKSIWVEYSFGTLKRTPITDIYLDGYKEVKTGTVPATITKAEGEPGTYDAGGGYLDFTSVGTNYVTEFTIGKEYNLCIWVDADSDHDFSTITKDNIHINGYTMPEEGVEIKKYNDDQTLNITLPAELATENILEFTIPEPEVGKTPAETAVTPENEDYECTGINWYRSEESYYDDSSAELMDPGETFEPGYYYYAKPQWKWLSEELTSYTVKINDIECTSKIKSFGRLKQDISINVTVAEPKVGAKPASTWTIDSPIDITLQCFWGYYPDGATISKPKLMDKNDTFKAGNVYLFEVTYDSYDKTKYHIEGITVNGMPTNYGCAEFYPALNSQKITGVSSTYSKAYGSSFTLKPAAKTDVTYKSSNTKIATVSKSGKVVIKGVGTAKITITAKGTDTYKSATKTITVKGVPKKPAVSKITSKKKSMTVKMTTKVSTKKGSYYQIAYRVKGTSKWKYKTTKNQSLTIKSLKKGKRYQVKVRAYKTVSKTKYYSSWSSIKTSAKIK